MIPEIVFSNLSPILQESIKYIATAAAGGIIGNRADSWFMSLFYHQRKNITRWLNDWEPKPEDLQAILENEDLRTIFSIAVKEISNESFEKKLLFWPIVTDSILRNKKLPFDKKQYFTKVYADLHPYSLYYLGSLSLRNIDYNDVFDLKNNIPNDKSESFKFYMGQMQCLGLGLTKIITKEVGSEFSLSPFGKKFVDFISDSSLDRILDMD